MEIEQWRAAAVASSDNVRRVQNDLEVAQGIYDQAENRWADKAQGVWNEGRADRSISMNHLTQLVTGETLRAKSELRRATENLRTARANLESAIATHNAILAEGRLLNSIIGAGG
jgi:two-component sensor histidine kinase